MDATFNINIFRTDKIEGYQIFHIVTNSSVGQSEYKIYVSDKDIPFRGSDINNDNLTSFAIDQMKLWIKDVGDSLPKEKYRILINGGKISTNDIDNFMAIKKDTPDLVRTNVTIYAPLFEWAKAKAKKEGTSFSDLVSRGLLTLKDSDKEVEAWYKEQGVYFRTKLKDYGSFEVFHYLPNNYKEFETDSIKTALQESEIRRTGWPIGVYLIGEKYRPSPQDDGIKAEYSDSPSLLLDYWYAKTKGEFYFSRNLESDSGHGEATPKTTLYFDTLIWRVAETLEHCLFYYQKLGIHNEERVKIRISLYGLSSRKLGAWNQLRALTLRHYVCSSDKSSWEIETSLTLLKTNLDETIYEAVKKLLVMFDFFVPNKEVVFDILNKEYRKSSY